MVREIFIRARKKGSNYAVNFAANMDLISCILIDYTFPHILKIGTAQQVSVTWETNHNFHCREAMKIPFELELKDYVRSFSFYLRLA